MSVWLHCVLIKFAAFALKLISDYETRSLASHNIQSTSEYYLNVHSSLCNRQSKIIVEVCEGIIVVQLFCFYDWSSSCSIESSVHWPEKERERERERSEKDASSGNRPKAALQIRVQDSSQILRLPADVRPSRTIHMQMVIIPMIAAAEMHALGRLRFPGYHSEIPALCNQD
jgi:hypothetical protein